MKPRWQEIEQEHPWLKTEYYDFDTHTDAVQRWKVDEGGLLPTCIFLDEKENEILRLHGEHRKEELIELIQAHKDR